MLNDISDYLLDHYGACALEHCACNHPRKPWRGRGCVHWKPAGAKTWEELTVIQRAQR